MRKFCGRAYLSPLPPWIYLSSKKDSGAGVATGGTPTLHILMRLLSIPCILKVPPLSPSRINDHVQIRMGEYCQSTFLHLNRSWIVSVCFKHHSSGHHPHQQEVIKQMSDSCQTVYQTNLKYSDLTPADTLSVVFLVSHFFMFLSYHTVGYSIIFKHFVMKI